MMKITAISVAKRDKNRVNISVDGKYRFSLDAYQLVELGIKVGSEYNEAELVTLQQESQFGKVYGRALEYCSMRPHSMREVKDYLYRKTRQIRDKTGKLRPGVAPEIAIRVFDRLCEKKYIDDTKFAHYWVENRSVSKGSSLRKISAELRIKGVSNAIISKELADSERNDISELQKIVNKKRKHYPDEKKFIAYLARLGFCYSDIQKVISENT